MLPNRRGFGSATSVAYKLSELPGKEGQKWRFFELENEHNIGAALAHLNRAYRGTQGPALDHD